jgi:putative SOS response-associated peptidase YedK
VWLDPGMKDMATASDLLKPYDARLMRSYPVSSGVNSVVNDDEACSAQVELAEAQARLFS